MRPFFIPRNARELAFVVLCSGGEDTEFAAQRLEQAAADQVVSPADRRLATELIYGVIRRAATLDTILKSYVRRGQQQVEPELWMILRLGAYQLVMLDGIPPHAAVHETVELSRRVGRGGWPGFVNGTLRGVSQLVTPDRTSQAAADSVPLANGQFGKLSKIVFPDPQTQPADYFAAAYSFPDWLAKRWAKTFPAEELFRLGTWFNLPAHLSLRINRLRTTRDEYLALLADRGTAARPGTVSESIQLDGSVRVDDLPHFAEGWVTIQDESSMSAALLMNPQPSERLLDLCAAPGGKTTHLAELQGDQGKIVAVDVQAERLAVVSANAARLQLKSIRTHLMSKDEMDAPTGHFDGVLVDVPCSNTGVLGKRPEARWRITPYDLSELPKLQRKLLNLALDRVRPGGRVVYSTCSIETVENRQVVEQCLVNRPNVTLAEERHHVPGQPADGGYQALLRVAPAEKP
ncbi:MAG: rRNA ((967)-C(5))-methyltransferase [Planctomycetaceae bacterium]|nr:rRNA ((967)-C(5))-methyltransferase [Planctomycetaceae bacterium]